MLTAAHCVAQSNKTVQSITVYLGRNGTNKPKTETVSSWYVCSSYIPGVSTNTDDDYAILRFNSAVSNVWFGLHYDSNDNNLANKSIVVAGYPDDKATTTSRTLWYCNGNIKSLNTYTFTHSADTYTGQSGAPAYAYSSVYGYQAYGIHVAGTSSENYARRITSELFDWLLSMGFISR